MGTADFQVVSAPDVLTELNKLEGMQRVTFLHSAGWFGDALLEARKLPPSPGRAQYIKALETR